MKQLIVVFSLFLLWGTAFDHSLANPLQQNVGVSDDPSQKLRQIQTRFEAKEYRRAYEELSSLEQQQPFRSYNARNRSQALRLGVELSFILDLFGELDRYLNAFYRFDSNFSAEDLPNAAPELVRYINDFLRSKQGAVVYVGKQKTDLDNIPASVTVFSADDISRLGVRNFMDLIRLVPGITEVGDNNERMIGARGFSSGTTTNDMLFLINGHRINDQLTTSANPDLVAIESIQQVEILRGSGSTFYGPNAFSAVINVITKRGSDDNNRSIDLQLSENAYQPSEMGQATGMILSAEYGEKISNTQSFYVFGQLEQDQGALINYTESNPAVSIDPSRTTGKEYINRYGPGYQLILNYISGAFEVTANTQLVNFRMPRTQTYELWQNFEADTVRNFRSRIERRSFVHASYNFLKNREEEGQSLSLHVGFDHFGKYIPFNNGFNRISDGLLQGDEFRQTARLEYTTNSFLTRETGNSFTLIGAEFNRTSWNYRYFLRDPIENGLEWVGNRAFRGQDLPDQEVYAGLYAQTERNLIEDKLKLSFGVRFNYHNVYAKLDRFKWGEEYNPRFNLVWNATDWFKAKLIYSSSFLAPPFLYRYGLPDGSQYNSVTTLRSQAVSNGQFMVFGHITEGLSYDVQMYQNKISNLIQREASGYANLGEEALIRGLEAELRYKGQLNASSDLLAFASYSISENFLFREAGSKSYFDGFNTDNLTKNADEQLAFFPEDMAKIGMSLQTKLSSVNDLNADALSNPATIATGGAKDGLLLLNLGFTAEYYGQSPVRSTWMDQNGDGTWQQVVPLGEVPPMRRLDDYWLLNVFAELRKGAFSILIGAYNAQNVEALLPTQYYIGQMGQIMGEPTRYYTRIKYRF